MLKVICGVTQHVQTRDIPAIAQVVSRRRSITIDTIAAIAELEGKLIV